MKYGWLNKSEVYKIYFIKKNEKIDVIIIIMFFYVLGVCGYVLCSYVYMVVYWG